MEKPSDTVPSGPQPSARCLFVAGADNNARVDRPNGKSAALGNNDLYRLIGDPQVPRIWLSPDPKRELPDISACGCVVNQISDPDQNPGTVANLERLLSGFAGRVINSPLAVLKSTRDEMAAQLAQTPGLRVPRVVRIRGLENAPEMIERACMSFPIILRYAGTHSGKIIGLFADMDDLRSALPNGGDLIATEFVDFRSADGLYRKYRIFVFGQFFVLRHMLASDEWNIHARDRKRFMLERPSLRDQEEQMLHAQLQGFDGSVGNGLKEARKRIGLDYYGMDFGVTASGEAVLFEANATMNFLPILPDPEFAYMRECLPIAHRAWRAMIPELSWVAV